MKIFQPLVKKNKKKNRKIITEQLHLDFEHFLHKIHQPRKKKNCGVFFAFYYSPIPIFQLICQNCTTVPPYRPPVPFSITALPTKTVPVLHRYSKKFALLLKLPIPVGYYCSFSCLQNRQNRPSFNIDVKHQKLLLS